MAKKSTSAQVESGADLKASETKPAAAPKGIDVVAIICRTQGVGRLLAQSIASKLSQSQKDEIGKAIAGKNSGAEILRILGDTQKEPIPKLPSD